MPIVPTGSTPNDHTPGLHELRDGNSILVAPYASFAGVSETYRGIVQLWYPIYDKVAGIKESEDVGWVGVVAAVIDLTAFGDTDPDSTSGPLETTDAFCGSTMTAAGTTFTGLDQHDAAAATNPPDKPVSFCRIATNGAKYVQFYTDYDGYDSRVSSTGINYLFAVV